MAHRPKHAISRCTRPTSVLLALALTGGGLATLGAAPASAAPADNDLFYGLTTSDQIVTFRTGAGTTLSTVAVNGLAPGDDIVGIDERPSTGQLYAVTTNPVTNDASIYVIDPATGAATEIGNGTADLIGTTFGVDFNPVTDRLRVISNGSATVADQNYSVNPETGVFTLDGSITPNDPAVPAVPPAPAVPANDSEIAGSAYTNNVGGAATTTLYNIDVVNNRLTIQATPASGDNTTVVGPLSATAPSATSEAGFDIDGRDGTAYAVLTIGAERGLYTVNLGTGAVTRVGNFTLANVVDITRATSRVGFADQDPRVGFTSSDIQVDETAGTATITVTRTGDVSQPATVNYVTSNGSTGPNAAASAAQDYTATSGTVSFAAGETSKTITVAILNDTVGEPLEDFTVTLTNPSSSTTIADGSVIVTIKDNDQGVRLLGLRDYTAPFGGIAGVGATAGDQRLVQIDTTTGQQVGNGITITGLTAGDDLKGIDFRPATGQVIGVARSLVAPAGAASIYTINPTSGVATRIAGLTDSITAAPLTLDGGEFAVDVNPQADALRVIDAEQNLNYRVNLTTGATTVDALITPGNVSVTGAAYSNSVAGATGTVLYGIDSTNDNLVEIAPPNDGLVTNRAPLGAGAPGTNVGFDIDGATGVGYASYNNTLFVINESQTTTSTPAATAVPTSTLNNIQDITVVNVAAPGNPDTTSFSVGSVTVAEGNTATVTVTRAGNLTAPATVSFTTSNGTATAGLDYTSNSGTLNFAAGQATATFTVAALTDALTEANETVVVTLSNPSLGTITGGPGTVTITDPSSVPTFTVANVTVAEGNNAVVTVTRAGSTAAAATVAYATSNGTAIAGADYTATSGTLTFAIGESTKTFSVPALADALTEPNETFTVTLSAPSTGTVGAPATVTITDPAVVASTSLTINASPLVRFPGTPTITGVLRNAQGQPLAGRTVTVIYKQQAVRGLSAFRPVLNLTTDAQGVYRGSIRPTVNAVWQAIYLGNTNEAASSSPYDVTKIQVTRPTVNGFGSTLTVRSTRTVNFSGVVQPGNVQHPVVVQWIRPDGIFNLTQPKRANSNGTYITGRTFAPGTYNLRVLAVNTDNNVGSASRTVTLRVVR